jgi:hypothetical protein
MVGWLRVRIHIKLVQVRVLLDSFERFMSYIDWFHTVGEKSKAENMTIGPTCKPHPRKCDTEM